MAKARMVSTSYQQEEWFGYLSFMEQALWYGLIGIADDQGRMLGNPTLIRSRVWPYQEVDLQEVKSGLLHLQQAGRIYLYQDDTGRELIQIIRWWTEQALQWAVVSDYQAPNGWTDRVRTKCGNMYVEVNWKDPIPNYNLAMLEAYQVATGSPDTISADDSDSSGDSSGERSADGSAGPTCSMLYVNTDSESSVLDSEGETPAPIAKRGKRTRIREPISEAVKVYQDITGVRANKLQKEAIDKWVTDLPKWERSIRDWRLAGYNPTRVDGMLDWYKNGHSKGKAPPGKVKLGNHVQDVSKAMALNDRGE